MSGLTLPEFVWLVRRAVESRYRHTICPACGLVSNVHENPRRGDFSSDGDLSVCAECREVSVYDSTRPAGLRPLTDDEAWMRDLPDVKRVRAALAESYTVKETLDLLRGRHR